jgi:hypothetical protein
MAIISPVPIVIQISHNEMDRSTRLDINRQIDGLHVIEILLPVIQTLVAQVRSIVNFPTGKPTEKPTEKPTDPAAGEFGVPSPGVTSLGK